MEGRIPGMGLLWLELPLPVTYGGARMPAILGAAPMEMLASAGMSFSTLSVLNPGAAEALAAHASDARRACRLPRLLSGEWCASMALTEPPAGADPGALAAASGESSPRHQRHIVATRFCLQTMLPHASVLAQGFMAGRVALLSMCALWQDG